MVLWIILLSIIGQCSSLDNGLALTPPMGWMHWQRYRCLTDCDLYPDECISERLFMRTADLMVSEGYLAAGYEFVMIDDCWMSSQRDPVTKKLQPDPIRFPSGIKELANYIHDKGLKLGIYGDIGTNTCAGYPGSLEYMELDAQTFAEWGVDYLKFDGCYVDIDFMETGYATMSGYLNNTGRPIVFSCSWPAYMETSGILPNYTALETYCNLWRNYDDIDDSWDSVTNIMDWFGKNQDRLVSFAGPGHWNDPDMLLVGNFGLSFEQSKAQLAVWSVLAAPFIMSVDLANIKPEFRTLLLNNRLIGINQDKLGHQGLLKLEKNDISIWTRMIEPLVGNFSSCAIAFISHRSDGYPYRIVVTPRSLGLINEKGYSLEDIFDPTELLSVKPDDDIAVRVKPSGAVLLKATPL